MALPPFTFAPFEVMKQNHNLHHANIGNLEHRETGEINTMTLAEWNAAGFWQRLLYRAYRNPFILVPLTAPLHEGGTWDVRTHTGEDLILPV